MEDVELKKFRVWMHSVPSPGSTYYDGYVDVWATDEEDAKPKAKKELRRTTFPERSDSSWVVDKVEECKR